MAFSPNPFMVSSLILCLCTLISLGSSYSIHQSCDRFRADVRAAADEAIRMAKHAKFRADLQNPPAGEIVDTLIGTPNGLQSFKRYMERVPKEVGEHSRGPQIGAILIKCGDRHLIESSYRPGDYLDFDWPRMRPTSNIYGTRFCSGDHLAITYETGQENPRAVVLLCETPSGDLKFHEVAIVENWNDAAVEGIEVDLLEDFMSVTLLHEFLHGIDGDQFPAELAPGVPEAYGVHDIKTLTSAQKMKNADSYALLAGGLYYRLRPLDKNGVFQRPYEKGREPPKGPHPEDSVLWIRNSDDEEDSDADFNANRRARTKAETIAHGKPEMSNIIQV
ncbi:hypothetical protein LOZ57_002131 [Ophidiomyces ophidiicola]|uniref:uncharacterized protein n=1 Tax=Ophidiomyces ophidiicola TaxID=1387563 RepID=UPI0020C2E060|nr:uncharacterized protein LOZ57_002131 [Ophidiomyces ophidiicola]KAI1950568.1 hypothetical protein LOZ57_002131 [Ophidiomyces ophidiicola]KAI2050703.1 hypothetical protein LOZ43_004891 [Ophidiomyces ophidiicola]